jgi:hypothetical protein
MAPNPLTLLHPAKLRDFLGHEVPGELDSLELKVINQLIVSVLVNN